MILVVHSNRYRRSGIPRMTVERTADHVPVRFVFVVSVRCRVHTNEPVTFGREPVVQKVLEDVLRDRQVARRVKHHDVIVLQLFFGKVLRTILSAVGAEAVAADPQVDHHSFGGRKSAFFARHRTVTKSFALCDEQQTRRLVVLSRESSSQLQDERCSDHREEASA